MKNIYKELCHNQLMIMKSKQNVKDIVEDLKDGFVGAYYDNKYDVTPPKELEDLVSKIMKFNSKNNSIMSDFVNEVEQDLIDIHKLS